jgi:hypothetical protein
MLRKTSQNNQSVLSGCFRITPSCYPNCFSTYARKHLHNLNAVCSCISSTIAHSMALRRSGVRSRTSWNLGSSLQQRIGDPYPLPKISCTSLSSLVLWSSGTSLSLLRYLRRIWSRLIRVSIVHWNVTKRSYYLLRMPIATVNKHNRYRTTRAGLSSARSVSRSNDPLSSLKLRNASLSYRALRECLSTTLRRKSSTSKWTCTQRVPALPPCQSSNWILYRCTCVRMT